MTHITLTPTCTVVVQRGDLLLALTPDGNDAARITSRNDLDALLAYLLRVAADWSVVDAG